jgi:hypothetical protein
MVKTFAVYYSTDHKNYIKIIFEHVPSKLLDPLQSRTGPEQGFPCVVFPHREKPVFITGFPGDENRFFPVRKTTKEKPCFHYRDGFAGPTKINIWRRHFRNKTFLKMKLSKNRLGP